MHKFLLCFFIVFCFSFISSAQQTDLTLRTAQIAKVDSLPKNYTEYNPLAPAKAAFYSAVLPGLGQAYNKRYWKIPIVYAALGVSTYFIVDNQNEYTRYRDAYKRRLAGHTDDEFYGRISTEGLINAQKQFRRNKEISILVTLGIYVLNIIDANVDAHLQQFNVNKDLSIHPSFDVNEYSGKANYGLSLNLNF
ncbi:MAG: DUF5683 domain-containing protein [Mesonia hippocampi]|uniref:DUF5683 domain-containing protein n=1 Tax=Mesonia hippocampi TaxID=1628250 RepID=UPI003F98C655